MVHDLFQDGNTLTPQIGFEVLETSNELPKSQVGSSYILEFRII
jgi:hypothetical protein